MKQHVLSRRTKQCSKSSSISFRPVYSKMVPTPTPELSAGIGRVSPNLNTSCSKKPRSTNYNYPKACLGNHNQSENNLDDFAGSEGQASLDDGYDAFVERHAEFGFSSSTIPFSSSFVEFVHTHQKASGYSGGLFQPSENCFYAVKDGCILFRVRRVQEGGRSHTPAPW